jgi:hypothetical protein
MLWGQHPNFLIRVLLHLIVIPINMIIKLLRKEQISVKNDLLIPFWTTIKVYFAETQSEAREDAKRHFIVKMFDWLEKHPVSQKSIKIAIFSSFVVFSFGEILTS